MPFCSPTCGCDQCSTKQLAVMCCREWMRQIGKRAWIMTRVRLEKEDVKFLNPTTGELYTVGGNVWYVLPHQAKLRYAMWLADEMVSGN